MTESTLVSFALTYLAHSTVLLGGLWIVDRWLVGREAWRDTLWKVGLVGVIATSALTLMRPWPAIRIDLQTPWTETELARPPSTQDDVEQLRYATSAPPALTNNAIAGDPRPVVRPSAAKNGARPRQVRTTESFLSPTFLSVGRRPMSWGRIFAFLWAAGAFGGLFLLLYRYARLYRVIAGRREVHDAALIRTLTELRRSAGVWRPVRLTATSNIGSPMVLNNNEICVPERFVTELTTPLHRAALAHELGHIARNDIPWQRVATVIERVFFFQPLNRIARLRLRESAEYLADEWAVHQTGARLDLAKGLAEVAGWVSPASEPAFARSVAMAEGGSPLTQRVRRLLEDEPRPAVHVFGRVGAGLSVLTALAMGGPTISALGQSPENNPAQPNPAPTASAAPTAAADAQSTPSLPRGRTLCDWRPPKDGNSVQAHVDDEHTSITVRSGNCRLEVRSQGHVALTEDDVVTDSLGMDSWFEIEERHGSRRYRAEFERRNGGKAARRWYESGVQKEWNNTSAQWFKDALLVVFRRTSFGAEERALRLFEQGGAPAVMQEAQFIQSASGLARTYTTLLDQADLDPQTILTIAHDARRIRSSSSRGRVLEQILVRAGDDRTVRLAVIASSATLSSTSRRSGVLISAAESGPLTLEIAEKIVDAARGIDSSSRLANVLLTVARQIPADSAVPANFMSVARGISSSNRLSSVLIGVVDRPKVRTEELQAVLETSYRIDSDRARSRVLKAVAARHRVDDDLNETFFQSVRRISSSSRKADTLRAVIAQYQDEATLLATIQTSRSISSDSHRAQVLIDATTAAQGHEKVRSAIAQVAQTISSSSRRRRVQQALERSTGEPR